MGYPMCGDDRRGERYFEREDVGDLHTAEGWRNRASREVIPEEMGRPVKAPPKRRRPQQHQARGRDQPALEDLPDDQVHFDSGLSVLSMPKPRSVAS